MLDTRCLGASKDIPDTEVWFSCKSVLVVLYVVGQYGPVPLIDNFGVFGCVSGMFSVGTNFRLTLREREEII